MKKTIKLDIEGAEYSFIPTQTGLAVKIQPEGSGAHSVAFTIDRDDLVIIYRDSKLAMLRLPEKGVEFILPREYDLTITNILSLENIGFQDGHRESIVDDCVREFSFALE